MDYKRIYREKLGTIQDCLDLIKSGDMVATAGVVCEPRAILRQLHTIADRLTGVEVIKGKGGVYRFVDTPGMDGKINTMGHFFSANMRDGYPIGNTSYIPCDLHNYMTLRNSYRPANIFIAQVTEMDENGNMQIPYCQMFEKEQLECKPTIILEVNPRCHRVRGGIDINIQDVACLVENDEPLSTIDKAPVTEIARAIGTSVAELIHDGDCIQLGIGAMPDTVAELLMQKNDLGLHTEMFTSTMAALIKSGVVNGKYKTFDKGEHVGAFALGNEELYETLSSNPACRMAPSSYVNNPAVIAQIDNFVSLNTCIEIDLTGQVCSESIGPAQYSGTGGSFDFAYGALHSKGGRGIVAFASTTKHDTISKIKPILTPGSAVSISRNAVDLIVTEYGIAYMRGRTVRERCEQLINIAHPKFRDELREEAKKLGYITK